jgi:UDP-N-acetyl-2-amino-2-deoxyglucuronate dehydrogenase
VTRRVVVVGAGLASAAHLTALQAVGANVLGVVTRNQARAAAAQRLAPTARIIQTVDEARALGADTAVIVTPPSTHREIASAFAELGMDLVIDKPLAATLDDAVNLVDMVQRAGVRAAVTLQHRYKPAAQMARTLVTDGAIGSVGSAVLTVPLWRPDSYYAESGRGTWARDGGGVLITQAIHVLDLYLLLTRRPRSVVAASATSHGRLEAEDTIHLLIEQDCCHASMFASTSARPGGAETVHLYGEAGQLRLDGDSLVRIGDDARTLVEGAVDASGADPIAMATWFHSLYDDVFTSWAGGRESLCELRSGLLVQSVIDAAYRSAAAGSVPAAVPAEREIACQS